MSSPTAAQPQSSPLLSLHQFNFRPLPPPSESTVSCLAQSFGPGSALILWLVDAQGSVDQLAASFPTLPKRSAAKVLGSPGSEDDPSQALSSLLSRKLNKPVFVGYNCSAAVGDDSKAVSLVHKAILEEVAANPQYF